VLAVTEETGITAVAGSPALGTLFGTDFLLTG